MASIFPSASLFKLGGSCAALIIKRKIFTIQKISNILIRFTSQSPQCFMNNILFLRQFAGVVVVVVSRYIFHSFRLKPLGVLFIGTVFFFIFFFHVHILFQSFGISLYLPPCPTPHITSTRDGSCWATQLLHQMYTKKQTTPWKLKMTLLKRRIYIS